VIRILLLSPALDVTHLVGSVDVGAIHRPREVLRLAGGKGLNLARAATALGARATVMAPLGGHLGALVRDAARSEGVEVHVVPIAAETRMCLTVAADDGTLTEFYEPPAPLTSAERDAVLTAFRDAAPDPPAGWAVLSGSVPASAEADVVVAALAARAAHGERIAVDTHGPALAEAVALRPDLVKVNRREATEFLGGSEAQHPDARELATAIRSRTGGVVVVTDGEHGSVGVDDSGAWRAAPPVNPGRYPVGSGDSFLAGLLVALDRGQPLREALAFATAAAAANAAVPGAARLSGFDAALAGAVVAAVEGDSGQRS
jgi:1-phosphofructokinase/tagatose 6-phosphate kinase